MSSPSSVAVAPRDRNCSRALAEPPERLARQRRPSALRQWTRRHRLRPDRGELRTSYRRRQQQHSPRQHSPRKKRLTLFHLDRRLRVPEPPGPTMQPSSSPAKSLNTASPLAGSVFSTDTSSSGRTKEWLGNPSPRSNDTDTSRCSSGSYLPVHLQESGLVPPTPGSARRRPPKWRPCQWQMAAEERLNAWDDRLSRRRTFLPSRWLKCLPRFRLLLYV